VLEPILPPPPSLSLSRFLQSIRVALQALLLGHTRTHALFLHIFTSFIVSTWEKGGRTVQRTDFLRHTPPSSILPIPFAPGTTHGGVRVRVGGAAVCWGARPSAARLGYIEDGQRWFVSRYPISTCSAPQTEAQLVVRMYGH